MHVCYFSVVIKCFRGIKNQAHVFSVVCALGLLAKRSSLTSCSQCVLNGVVSPSDDANKLESAIIFSIGIQSHNT